ncbi:MAG: AAA family ATPase [Ardenticatenaceae bacterium]|nr:AAA family ATPase [Ardenticatenaceae bacterium]MCB9443279.1 AAA family ATPase [Ardenticatenaceae bacterium]
MKDRERILQAISVIGTQRILLGDPVVNITLEALNEQLTSLDADHESPHTQRTAQRKQITILFANVTGFNSITQAVPDTNILDIMNLLWQRLDKAITNQGGTIDKHIGDAVMGLFGVPVAREDDPERAIQAALAMRAALSDFANEMVSLISPSPPSKNISNAGSIGTGPLQLQLRIGINTGPVLLGGVGSGDEYTVIGDAVNVASRLERTAPAGGILISHDTYLLVRGIFDTEPLGPVTIRGKSDPVQVYLVLGAKPRRSFLTGRGVEGVETQMVGRDSEMALLQNSLQTAVSTGTGQVITVVGEAGVGKSRLIQEFTDWALSQPQEMPMFRGQIEQRMNQQPYALIRNMLSTHFDIQDSDPSHVVEMKMAQGIQTLTRLSHQEIQARTQTIGQLIGLNLGAKTQQPVSPTEAPQIRIRAFGYLRDIFKQVVTDSPATLMILEDLHWADKPSLELIEFLAGITRDAPLLIFCLTRPLHNDDETICGHTKPGETAVPQTSLHLNPLTEIESRQLVSDILRKLPEVPQELCNFVVERAEGNPFYVEELIKVFIEDGIILAGEDKWQIKSTQLSSIRIPTTLTGVLQARLDRLSELERATLQRAAVIGRQFWDSAVIQMNELAADPLHASETIAALQALEKREMIFKRHTSIFSGTQTYHFKHAILREVTYEGVLLRDRPVFHRQAADWLTNQSSDRIAEYAGLIAEHYELAGEKPKSAELYEIAAVRAQGMADPDRAITYFGKSLFLLIEKSHDTAWQLRLQKRLGTLLQMQGRLIEAAQTYMTMRYTAEIDGDLASQAHAWNGLAITRHNQGKFDTMLEAAAQAEQVAWLVGAEEELAAALLLKSKAHLYLGDTELASAAANRALSISDRQHDMTTTMQCLALLTQIYIESGRENRALLYLEELADQLDLPDLEPQVIAHNKAEQGRLYRLLEQYDQAGHELMNALDQYRELDDQSNIAAMLNQLAELARLRGTANAAVPLYRDALDIARAIGDEYAALTYRTNLAAALGDLGQAETALTELQKVLSLAENVSKVVSWIDRHVVYQYLAQVYLLKNNMVAALAAAWKALELAPKFRYTAVSGAVWRTLGQIAIQSGQPVTLNEQSYTAVACFEESLRHLREQPGGLGTKREQILTLRVWADWLARQGDELQANDLRAQANTLATRLGLEPTRKGQRA